MKASVFSAGLAAFFISFISAGFGDPALSGLPFTESFVGIPGGEIPPGWARDVSNWGVWGSQEAGGDPPEMRFNYSPPITGDFYLITPRIDTSGYGDLHLLFKNSVDNFGDPGPYSLKVVAIAGGVTRPIHEWAAPGDIPAEQFATVLTAAEHGVGSEDFYLAWIFSGNSFYINYWYFDDIYLADTTPTPSPTPEGYQTPSPTPTPSSTPEGYKTPTSTPVGPSPSVTPTPSPSPTLPPFGLPYTENFTGISDGKIPPGWARDVSNWGVWGSREAGGDPPEMRFNYSPPITGDFYLITPRIDTSGYGDLHLLFKNSVNNFGDPGPYSLKVAAIAGGVTRPIHEWAAPGDIPAEQFATVLTAAEHGVGSEDFYLAWIFSGNSFYINYWYFDDVSLSDQPPPTPTPTPSLIPTPSVPPTPSPTATSVPTPEPPLYLVLGGGDYNGDGLSDIAIFRPRSGLWAVRGLGRVYFGRAGDIPVPGDYRGDGLTRVAIYRPKTGLWAVKDITRLYFGPADSEARPIPVPADYSGDGRNDPGIFIPATGLWAVRGVTRVYFGTGADLPVPADYNRAGLADIAVYRPAAGLWAVRGLTRIYFGGEGDIPVPGRYAWYGPDGQPFPVGFAIFRPATGLWAIRGGERFYFGTSGDYPVPGVYSGNNQEDIGIFRADSGLWAIRGITRAYFGASGDLPVTR